MKLGRKDPGIKRYVPSSFLFPTRFLNFLPGS